MRIKELKRYLTYTMHRRLILYTFTLVLLLSVFLTGTVMLFGRFSYVEQQTAATLAVQLSVYERDIANYFDQVAVRGIKLSEELSERLDAWLEGEGLGLSELSGNPEGSARMEDNLYETLYRWLTLTDCSGAYFLLDATANTSLPGAERSKCGMYVKIANINVSKPADPKLVLYRGNTEVGSIRRLEFHNMWALEFIADNFPEYDTDGKREPKPEFLLSVHRRGGAARHMGRRHAAVRTHCREGRRRFGRLRL